MTTLKNAYVQIGLLIGFVVLLAWAVCARYTSEPAQSSECIPPPVQIAYPYGVFRGSGEPNDSILPPPEWEPQLSAEQLAQIRFFYSAKSIVARGNDIWFTDNDTLARYRPDTDELTTYSIQFEGYDFVPSQLFLSQDGTLWGVDHIVPGGNAPTGIEIPGDLSRYDAKNDRFEPAPDKDGILTGAAGYTPITEDAQGRLWLIRDWVLFSFDPETRQAQRVLDEQRGYSPRNLVGAPDGSIWIAAYRTDTPPPEEKPVIVRYDPRMDEIEYHGPPPDVRARAIIPNMYWDSVGRLWINDYGWREISPTGEAVWYKLIRSPVFITNRFQGAGDRQYAWTSPSRMYESSNGLFWFSSGAGLVRLDFQSGEWCLLTTLTTPVVEDDDHNLWIGGNGQLYKYHLDN
jgi:sugar lactone lactonase YvrE